MRERRRLICSVAIIPRASSPASSSPFASVVFLLLTRSGGATFCLNMTAIMPRNRPVSQRGMTSMSWLGVWR